MFSFIFCPSMISFSVICSAACFTWLIASTAGMLSPPVPVFSVLRNPICKNALSS